MSEVSLKAAYRTYRKHATSNSLRDLCRSIVRGQRDYGYTITEIHVFIDDGNDVQLFYVRGGDRKDLYTSSSVRRRKMIWKEPDKFLGAPRYLADAYAFLLEEEGVSAEEIAQLGLPPRERRKPVPLGWRRLLWWRRDDY